MVLISCHSQYLYVIDGRELKGTGMRMSSKEIMFMLNFMQFTCFRSYGGRQAHVPTHALRYDTISLASDVT
jgi:hypothetical protein